MVIEWLAILAITMCEATLCAMAAIHAEMGDKEGEGQRKSQ